MSKTLVRSLIAGSVSAVASLSMFATTDVVHASGGCDPIYIDNGDGTAVVMYPDFCEEDPAVPSPLPYLPIFPIEVDFGLDFGVGIDDIAPLPPLPDCTPLDLTNLEVRAAQTSPDDWQWRFWINGDTTDLCNDTLEVEMIDLDTPDADLHYPTVWNIVDVNNEGDDLIIDLDTPCHYTTSVRYGAEYVLLDQYADQHKLTVRCTIVEVPDTLETPDTPETPATPETPETPDRPETPGTPGTPETPGTPGLPRTGSDSTGLLVGAGMLVLGAGLAFTSVSMTRKRRAA